MEKGKAETLTVDEKLHLMTGSGAFSAFHLPEKGFETIRMTDGPSGVKTSDGDAVCFMNTCLVASSWDREICYETGKMIAAEANRLGKDLLLAPTVNIKRNPLAGRNFECYSEDPYLTGILASAFINGVQEEGVSACVKHFACNNQETHRWTQNSVVDEDTLRNIYLKAFEIIVQNTDVDCVMASYNRVNGEYACQNRHLLKDILRKEWGYDGVVMSDWCAVSELIPSMQNGLDLEMPGNAHNSVEKLELAYQRGEISEKEIDEKYDRFLRLYEKRRARKKADNNGSPDSERLVRMTGESFVLLKNQGVLPLKNQEKILLVGNAKNPRIQGGGCAQLLSKYTTTPYEEIAKRASVCDCIDGYDVEEYAENVKLYDKIIVFLSLPEDCDSEAFDRTGISFPAEQLLAVERIASSNRNVIAVLQNGSAVDLWFADCVKGILETYYGGSYGGRATASVLYGEVTPSGKLAESFPMSLKDVPNANEFGQTENVYYKEREFVGYRYYTSYGVSTRYPFGFGLSYAQFNWKNIRFVRIRAFEFDVEVEIENESECYDGKETVQIYLKSNDAFESKMQLIAFQTVRLAKGERKRILISLDRSAFERYRNGKKVLIEGEYSICVARDCERIVEERVFAFECEKKIEWNRQTLLGDLLSNGKYREITLKHMQKIINVWAYGKPVVDKNFEIEIFLKNSVYNMPLRAFTYFDPKLFDDKKLDEFLEILRSI